MHEVVHQTFHSKLLSALRLPSFAGTGLPERMRSISFALLGLTAAVGLALVAIFAQLSFPVLSPAPLPDEPTASESISVAKRLPLGRTQVSVLPAQPAHLQPQQARAVIGAPTEHRSPAAGGSNEGNQVAPAAVDTPAPASEPEVSGGSAGAGGNSGGGGTAGEAGGRSDYAPTSAPAQPTTPPPAPAPSPHPGNPKPEAIASAPKPEPAPGPGNSSSAAAAEHANERGIEASAGAGPPASTAAPAPEAATPPGNGNGLAKGHDK